jgi:hypothetical protein
MEDDDESVRLVFTSSNIGLLLEHSPYEIRYAGAVTELAVQAVAPTLHTDILRAGRDVILAKPRNSSAKTGIMNIFNKAASMVKTAPAIR